MSSYNIMCEGEGTIHIFDVHNNTVSFNKPKAMDQNELAPTSAPMWMDHH
jgi:hypothetical protein